MDESAQRHRISTAGPALLWDLPQKLRTPDTF
jgi:hypothetical protein